MPLQPNEFTRAHAAADAAEGDLAAALLDGLRDGSTKTGIKATLEPLYSRLYMEGFRTAREELGLGERVEKADDSPDVVRRRVQRHVDELAAALLKDGGLTARQKTRLQNMRRELRKQNLETAEIRARVDQEKDRLRRIRALRIARTESIRAVNAGMLAAWDDAVDRGEIEKTTAVKEWVTTHDSRTCRVCRPHDGKQRRFGSQFGPFKGEAFASWLAAPPAHPNCRCVLQFRVVGIGDVRKAAEGLDGLYVWADGELVWKRWDPSLHPRDPLTGRFIDKDLGVLGFINLAREAGRWRTRPKKTGNVSDRGDFHLRDGVKVLEARANVDRGWRGEPQRDSLLSDHRAVRLSLGAGEDSFRNGLDEVFQRAGLGDSKRNLDPPEVRDLQARASEGDQDAMEWLIWSGLDAGEYGPEDAVLLSDEFGNGLFANGRDSDVNLRSSQVKVAVKQDINDRITPRLIDRLEDDPELDEWADRSLQKRLDEVPSGGRLAEYRSFRMADLAARAFDMRLTDFDEEGRMRLIEEVDSYLLRGESALDPDSTAAINEYIDRRGLPKPGEWPTEAEMWVADTLFKGAHGRVPEWDEHRYQVLRGDMERLEVDTGQINDEMERLRSQPSTQSEWQSTWSDLDSRVRLVASLDREDFKKAILRAEAAQMTDHWAVTSSGDRRAVALQAAVARRFDIDPGDYTREQMAEMGADELLGRNGPMYDAWVDETYFETQRALEEAGIETVTVHRGMRFHNDENVPPSLLPPAVRESMQTGGAQALSHADMAKMLEESGVVAAIADRAGFDIDVESLAAQIQSDWDVFRATYDPYRNPDQWNVKVEELFDYLGVEASPTDDLGIALTDELLLGSGFLDDRTAIQRLNMATWVPTLTDVVQQSRGENYTRSDLVYAVQASWRTGMQEAAPGTQFHRERFFREFIERTDLNLDVNSSTANSIYEQARSANERSSGPSLREVLQNELGGGGRSINEVATEVWSRMEQEYDLDVTIERMSQANRQLSLDTTFKTEFEDVFGEQPFTMPEHYVWAVKNLADAQGVDPDVLSSEDIAHWIWGQNHDRDSDVWNDTLITIDQFRAQGVGAELMKDTPVDTWQADGADMNPLSSWSVNIGESVNFAGGDNAMMLTMEVPRERVFATARTGLGAIFEEEFVLLGGANSVHAEVKYGMDSIRRAARS